MVKIWKEKIKIIDKRYLNRYNNYNNKDYILFPLILSVFS